MTGFQTWVDMPPGHGFGVHTLPYGSVTLDGGGPPRVGVAIGEHVLDLTAAAARLLPARAGLFTSGRLDPLLAAGPAVWADVRGTLRHWLTSPAERHWVEPFLLPAARTRPALGFRVGDFADFYSSEHHARNAGRIFRPGQPPLPPAWKRIPLGYHSRAGAVVVSGTPVRRPAGPRRVGEGEVAVGPSAALDFEAEVGFVVGVPTQPGRPARLAELAAHVFGVCLVNDWSARDIQALESVPLGPFLSKSFATSVGGWVIPLAALSAAWVAPPPRDPPPLGYLDDTGEPPGGLDLRLEVRLNGATLARPPAAALYWTAAQQFAHLTVTGAGLTTGDLFASGTVSGPSPDQWGSLLELSWAGTRPVRLPGGGERAYLADGDEVIITGTAPGPGGRVVGLGEVRGVVTPG